jgi:tetratricopeptide (TPR) repeat protein
MPAPDPDPLATHRESTDVNPVPNRADPLSNDPEATLDCPDHPGAQYSSRKTVQRFIGEYQILGELGRGTFGIVYRARDSQLNREVALKVLQIGLSGNEDELIRFRAEAETLGSLQHPGIVQIHNTGMHAGTPYLVMELVEGGSLVGQLKGEPRKPREAAEMVECLARAIHVAHQKGIIHRDLKPGNILCAVDGSLKITDFGLAKRLDHTLGLSRTGQAIGTPFYMAPEQAAGKKEIGPAADVYALGAILYELLTGRPPFCGPDVLAVLDQVRSLDPLSPSRLVSQIPRDLCTICLKCLHKSPNRRYASAEALADDLQRFLNDQVIVARPAGSLERVWRLVRRRPIQTAVVSLLLVVFVLSGVLSWVVYARHRDQEIAELKHREDEQRREFDRKLQQFIQEEYSQSLDAIDGILRRVLESKEPGLEPLHKELLNYYTKLIERQERSQLASQDKLADNCLRLGKLIYKKGELPDAQKALTRAKDLYEKLVQNEPHKPRFRQYLARTLLLRGQVLAATGQKADARKDYEAARGLLEKLREEDPNQVAYQRDLAETFHWLAVVCARDETKEGRQQAKQFYERALVLRQPLAEGKGTRQDRTELARTYGYLGDLLMAMNELGDADTAYWQSHRLRKELAEEDRDNGEARFELARSWNNFANYQMRVRALDTAEHFLEESLKIREDLVTTNPSVSDYRRDLAGAYNRLAELKLIRAGTTRDKKRCEEAHQAAEKAESIYRGLEKTRSINTSQGLAESLLLLARGCLDGSPGEARKFLSEAKPFLQEVEKQQPTARSAYLLSTLYALEAELDPAGSEAKRTEALKELETSLKRGPHYLDWDDMRQDRAFRNLRDSYEFAKLKPASS